LTILITILYLDKMTTKSKMWNDIVRKVNDVLSRMYDTDANGHELTVDSVELIDTINRIKSISIDMFNGTYKHYPFPEEVARQIVSDELTNRRTN
jgi:hypothetical protein